MNSRLKVLLNFGTLKEGGGQNVGLNFLDSLLRQQFAMFNFSYIVVKGSKIYEYLKNQNVENIIICPAHPIKRIIFEILKGRSIIKKFNIQIIYTYFGIGFFPKIVPQVSGSADSNLYYPEIDFWNGYKGFSLLKRKIVDKYRIWGLKRADAIIFENHDMLKRYNRLFKFSSLVKYIKPSVSVSLDDKNSRNIIFNSDEKKGLFLCGWHLNKNIMIIPHLAKILKSKNIPFKFILTAPLDNSILQKKFFEMISKLDVDEYVSVIGPVQKEDLTDLYNSIDFVFLLSQLESFSNNIIESWFHKKVLIISDASWAKSICEDGAFYVDRNDPVKIVEAILDLLNDESKYNAIVEQGIKLLNTYPKIDEKTKQEVEFLKYVYEEY